MLQVLVDEEVVGEVTSPHRLPMLWQHGGTRLSMGYHRGLPVSDDYTPPNPWNGALHRVDVVGFGMESLIAEIIRFAMRAD